MPAKLINLLNVSALGLEIEQSFDDMEDTEIDEKIMALLSENEGLICIGILKI